jgi:hypothetical protein
MHGSDLLVQVYSGISHSDWCDSGSIILLLLQGGEDGATDKWLYPPSGCSRRTLGVVASF